MAKIIAKTPAKSGTLQSKRTGRHKGDPQARQAEASVTSQPSHLATTEALEGSRGMTEKDPSTTTPVRTDNPVAQWQPIATAPKDGKWLLLSRRGGVRARIGAWDSELESWTVEGVAYGYQPTHWMVLPSPINIKAVRS